MRSVLVIDTSILCVWLEVPGMACCGPDDDRWDLARVRQKIEEAEAGDTVFVLPLATLIETGNHIAQAPGQRKDTAERLAEVMRKSADNRHPWAAFSTQTELWTPENLTALAQSWPPLAAQKLSLGDATIKDVAAFYATLGYAVEILTGDKGLKAYEPAVPEQVPRRRKKR